VGSAVVVRTQQAGNSVLIDFFAGHPLMQAPPCDAMLSSEGVNKPSTLSLSACCRIIEDHGGWLSQSSASGVHAFSLELPIAAKTTAQPGRAAHSGL
jgi:hypothetical protein